MDPRKLKVNELKEQLQLAGLSVNGKKEELVARLLEHLKAEEDAVNAGGPSTGAGDTFEWDESKFDVDDLAPPSEPAPVSTVEPATSAQASEPSASDNLSSSALSEQATPATAASTKSVNTTSKSTVLTSQPSVSGETIRSSTTGSLQFQGATKDAETLKAEFEKRKNRAARFGIPLKEQDKAIERAARFGVPVAAKVTASLTKVTDNDAAASSKTTPAKPGSVAAQIPADVLKKRQERFGIQAPASTTTSSGSSGSGTSKKSALVLDAAEEEKKRKRAAKFGLVPDGNDSNKKMKA
ncbi:hypothetical protein BGZ80_001522 [Entomortierella chlamydospora]|uniref:SAP domain-containing protein n=1 Tax=Entomortierella chlamydospora TaxID=101097 RepID=A0A9P6N1N0_9FUNG|nr:hypothetical protein BGZ80_001522 [Entomortierella chlamydospora]